MNKCYEIRNIRLDNKKNIDYSYIRIMINSNDEKSINIICFFKREEVHWLKDF